MQLLAGAECSVMSAHLSTLASSPSSGCEARDTSSEDRLLSSPGVTAPKAPSSSAGLDRHSYTEDKQRQAAWNKLHNVLDSAALIYRKMLKGWMFNSWLSGDKFSCTVTHFIHKQEGKMQLEWQSQHTLSYVNTCAKVEDRTIHL